jgi:adenosylcobinamide-GDP ribazoletransferase
MRGLIAATQFLTRLPVPRLRNFESSDLSRSAIWFPVVGLLVGAAVATCGIGGALVESWFGALLATVAWVWITGALHLDGLADLADALGASHRDRARFFEVLHDPHLGVFGATTLFLAIASKLVLLHLLLSGIEHVLASLTLICAWARLGPLVWSRWLRPLAEGSGERFAWSIDRKWIFAWLIALLILSVLYAPLLALAPIVIAGWGLYLHVRLGGMTGDCLGAGVEVVEIGLLLITAIGHLPIEVSV